MATGYSSIPSQLSHGGCGGDEGRLTHSPPGPRTLRRGELHGSPRHAVHDTGDDGQSDGQAAALRHHIEDYRRWCWHRHGAGADCRLVACWRYIMYAENLLLLSASASGLQQVLNICHLFVQLNDIIHNHKNLYVLRWDLSGSDLHQ